MLNFSVFNFKILIIVSNLVTNVNIEAKVSVPQMELKNKENSASKIHKSKLKKVAEENRSNKKRQIHEIISIKPSKYNEKGIMYSIINNYLDKLNTKILKF